MEMLSHLPDGSGNLAQSGLGGRAGTGIQGEYLASSGGGGRKEGLDTITGVCGVECEGEQGGVVWAPSV